MLHTVRFLSIAPVQSLLVHVKPVPVPCRHDAVPGSPAYDSSLPVVGGAHGPSEEVSLSLKPLILNPVSLTTLPSYS